MKKYEEKPYIIERKIIVTKKYNPKYGNDRICQCGHKYDRHFDWMNENEPCGCKYCKCFEFIERKL